MSALLTLHELLKSVQHLRLTGKHWPKRDRDDTPSSANDNSTPVAPTELDPIVDLSLFPNVSILEIEAVPPEALRNLSVVFPKLRLLKFEVRMVDRRLFMTSDQKLNKHYIYNSADKLT